MPSTSPRLDDASLKLGYRRRVMIRRTRRPSHRDRRAHRARAMALLGAAALMVLALALPGAADVGDVAQQDPEVADRVESIRLQLFGIAGLAAVLLAVYVWHTSPRRRARRAGAEPQPDPGLPADETLTGAEEPASDGPESD